MFLASLIVYKIWPVSTRNKIIINNCILVLSKDGERKAYVNMVMKTVKTSTFFGLAYLRPI